MHATMLVGTKGVTAMYSGIGDATGDDLPVRRAIPEFPWGELRRVLILSGSTHRSNTKFNPVPMTTHRHSDGIPYAAMESAKHGPVMTAIARAFNENDRRHNLTPAHWKVLLACEAGLVYRTISGHPFTDKAGVTYRQEAQRLVLYRPERPDAVLPYDEAPKELNLAASTAREYHRLARRGVEDEWRWLHSGYEG